MILEPKMKYITYVELEGKSSHERMLDSWGPLPRFWESVTESKIEHKGRILYYLKRVGHPYISGMKPSYDVFTGECTKCIDGIMSDGEYMWPSDLAYYIEKYNLMLPDDFTKHILQSFNQILENRMKSTKHKE